MDHLHVPPAAVLALQEALNVHDPTAEVYYYLGRALIQLGDLKGAGEMFSKAMFIDQGMKKA